LVEHEVDVDARSGVDLVAADECCVGVDRDAGDGG